MAEPNKPSAEHNARRASLRPEARETAPSGIVEVFNYGRGRADLIPLWVGESDRATPGFIVDAAHASLAAGETFYMPQCGHPDLRQAIARYMSAQYGKPFANSDKSFTPDRFFATVGGMHALQIASRMLAGAGDEVVILTPAWPNFAGALSLAGARVVEVQLSFVEEAGEWRWRLDPERLRAAISERTRAIVVNTPANPTGWTASLGELADILNLARAKGLWVLADEIYGRLVHTGRRAPSFHDLIDEGDRVLFVQTLSKNWAMTGWRAGWLEAPAELGDIIENLIQYSTSGVAMPMQRAAIAALDQGEPFLAEQIADMRRAGAHLREVLTATSRVRAAPLEGTFYLFCAVDGEPDTRALALRLVDEAGVGVAPGTAFGAGGSNFLRLCFARRYDDVVEAGDRLAKWLKKL